MNCHVIAAPSMVAMFENFVSVTQEEDVPQVSKRSVGSSCAAFTIFLHVCLAQGSFRDSKLNGLSCVVPLA